MSEVLNARIRDAKEKNGKNRKTKPYSNSDKLLETVETILFYLFWGLCGNHIFEKIEITRRVSECAAIGSPTKKKSQSQS